MLQYYDILKISQNYFSKILFQYNFEQRYFKNIVVQSCTEIKTISFKEIFPFTNHLILSIYAEFRDLLSSNSF